VVSKGAKKNILDHRQSDHAQKTVNQSKKEMKRWWVGTAFLEERQPANEAIQKGRGEAKG